jgi:ligand-binding sensor domain-containing protein
MPRVQAPRHDPRLWTSRQDSDWLWLPTVEGQIEAYDGEKWRVYGQHAGITSKSWLVSLSEEGRVWAVGRGISTAQEGERWWKDHNFFSGIAAPGDVSDIAVDAKGGLWISFVGSREQGGGVCRFDPDANLWQSYLHALNPTIPLQVRRVEVDSEGAIWLCGDGGPVPGTDGLTVRRWGRPWETIPLGHVEAQCFLQKGDRYWLGTARGIWSMGEGGADAKGPWLIPSPLLDNAVDHLARDGQGRLWIGTEHGTSYIDASGETGILTTEETLCLATSRTGLIWVGTRNGLYTASTDGAAVRMFDGGVIALAFDAGNVPWICAQDGQLFRLSAPGDKAVANLRDLSGALPRDMVIDSEGTVWFSTELGLGSLSADKAFRLFTVDDDLLSDDVRAVALGAEDLLWIATAKGLVRRRPSGRWTRFTTHSTEGGLRAMSMQNVYTDAEDVLWMATDAGVSYRTPEEADWSYFDVPDAQCALPDPSGVIWVGTSNGLYRVERSLFTSVP